MKRFILKHIYKLLSAFAFRPFFALNVKPIEFIPVEGEKYLVIAPHPDDESIGCGGILSLYPEFFDVVCLTHGAEDDIRKEEFSNAMNFAGIKNYKMLNIKDKHIDGGQPEFNEINISDYNIVFIPYVFDQHKDHKSVSILLSELLKKTNADIKIAFYEVWSTIALPNYFVNISSVVNEKKEMINCHKSQIASKNYADKITGLNAYRGLLKNLDAAECFSIMSISDFSEILKRLNNY